MDLTTDITLPGAAATLSDYSDQQLKEQKEALDFLLKDKNTWSISKPLKEKIKKSGKLKPFFGDTTIFTVHSKEINAFVPEMLEKLDDVLAEPLKQDLYHVTLHDLCNGPEHAPLKTKIKNNETKCKALFEKLYDYLSVNPAQKKIRFKATNLYPCNNIALLLGLVPATLIDYKLLMNVYTLIDEIYGLEYLPQFHITLAYFKPQSITASKMKEMGKILTSIDVQEITVEVNLMNLSYQHFKDMNTYENLFKVGI